MTEISSPSKCCPNSHINAGGLGCVLKKTVICIRRDNHVTISLDTNYDSTETWNLDSVLPFIDIFMPNEVLMVGG